jgi:hypothetical protein
MMKISFAIGLIGAISMTSGCQSIDNSSSLTPFKVNEAIPSALLPAPAPAPAPDASAKQVNVDIRVYRSWPHGSAKIRNWSVYPSSAAKQPGAPSGLDAKSAGLGVWSLKVNPKTADKDIETYLKKNGKASLSSFATVFTGSGEWVTLKTDSLGVLKEPSQPCEAVSVQSKDSSDKYDIVRVTPIIEGTGFVRVNVDVQSGLMMACHGQVTCEQKSQSAVEASHSASTSLEAGEVLIITDIVDDETHYDGSTKVIAIMAKPSPTTEIQ